METTDRRRRVFVAAESDERDLWVQYVGEGMKVRALVHPSTDSWQHKHQNLHPP